MEEMQHTDRPVLRFFYNFRAYLRSSLPMALRGRGSVLNSTAVIRWYSGRVRFSPVIKARTSACYSSAQQIRAPILLPISLTTHSCTSGQALSFLSSSSGLTFSPVPRMIRFFFRPTM